MKTKPNTPSIVQILVLTASLLVTGGFSARAADGTWINVAGGNWSDPTSWQGGTIASGPGSTAFFNGINIPTNSTITVTADYADGVTFAGITNANLLFGDTDTSDGAGNWVVNEGGLGITLQSPTTTNSIVDVTLATGASNNLVTGWGTATINANVTGPGTLVKTGPSHLILSPTTANSYAGGTVISNGMVQLGNSATALGPGPVYFYGGSLRLQLAAIPGSNPSVNTSGRTSLPNNLVVPTGQSGLVYMPPRPDTEPGFSGSVSGGGTLTMWVDYVRGNIGGDWTAFTGHLNVASSTRGNSDLRFDTSFVPSGWANAAVTFTNNGVNANIVNMYNPGLPIGTVVQIGQMSASIPGIVNVISATTNVNNGAGGSAPFVLEVGGLNTDASFSGNFPAGVGSVGLIKVGTGTWTLNGPTVEYTGNTVVSNGVLQIGSGTSGKLGRSAVVTNYATLAFGRSDALTVTNVIDGSGILQQVGAGTLTLAPSTGTNTYTGKTVVKNGSLTISGQPALGVSPATFTADQLTLDGGSFQAITSIALDDANRGISLGASGGSLGADAGNTLAVSSIIGGAGDLTINNSGTVSLTGANTYSGKTILSSGVLAIGSETALGVNPASFTADQLTLDGGTLQPTGSLTIDDSNRGVTLAAGGGTFDIGAGAPTTLGTPIAGTGSLTKLNSGTLTLNAANTYTGDTLVNAGTLALGASGNLGATDVSIASGATFDVSAASGFSLGAGATISGFGTVAGNLTIAGGTLSPGGSVGTLTISGNLTENGGALNSIEISSTTNDLVQVNGNLNLSGVNTIALTLLESLPVGTYHLIKYTGSLSGTVANLTLTGYPLSRVTGTLAIDSVNKTVDLVVSGSIANLVWQGGLNGNAWDLNTTANWLNGVTADVFLVGDNVTFDATGAANPNVNLVGALQPNTVTVNASTDYTFGGSGNLTGFSSLQKSGTGKLTLLTQNDNTGGTTISGGTVQVGNGTTGGSLGAGDVTDNAALVFNLPGSLTHSSAISGTGTLALQAGTLSLGADNSYSGGTTIAVGSTLQAGSGGNAGSVGSGNIANDGTLAFNRTGTLTNTGAISGAGGVTVEGGGTIALSANNSYSGATLVDNGTLQVGAGGTSGSLGSAGTATVNSSGTLAFNRSDMLTNSVVVTGAGALRQQGAGTLVIVSSNSYDATLIDPGTTLQISDGNTNRFYSVLVTNIDTVNLITNVVTNFYGSVALGTGTVTDDGSLVANQAYYSILGNTITGSGSLTQIGAGPLAILRSTAAGNTYTGGTIISNASVLLTFPAGLSGQAQNDAIAGADAGLGTGPATFLVDSTLQLAEATVTDQGSTPTFATPLVVPAGQTATVEAPGRYTFSSTVSGSGTFNLGVNYVRGNVSGVWTNFLGLLNVVTNSVNTNGPGSYDFRWANNLGLPNAKVHLGDNVSMYSKATANLNIPIGELTGTASSSLRSTSGGGTDAGVNENWVVGGLNTDATFDGTLLDGISVTKVGTGKWTLTGANQFTGNMTVSNGVLAFGVSPVDGVTVGSISSASLVAPAGPGIIDASGFTDHILHIGDTALQTLGGNGTVQGAASIGVSGSLAPGFSSNVFGNLTITGNLVIDGGATFKINAYGANDSVTAPSITVSSLGSPTATLTVTQVDTNDLPTGITFKLLSTPMTGGGFAAVTLPSFNSTGSITYEWTNRLAIDGTIKLLVGGAPIVNPNPTNITFTTPSGGQMTISWPADHLGWKLQVQTNTLSQGLGNNWVDVPGSTAVTSMNVPVSPSNGAVFYRLAYPTP